MLYSILSIKKSTIKKCILEVSIEKKVDAISKFHSYFHFEQAFAYILAAFILKNEELLEKALFQDHQNTQAKNFIHSIEHVLSYNKHFQFEISFLHFALGDFLISEEVLYLDNFIHNAFSLKKSEDIKFYPSHRFLVAQTIDSYLKNLPESRYFAQSLLNFLEKKHKAYHQYLANVYLERSKYFQKSGNDMLAKNDLIRYNELIR